MKIELPRYPRNLQVRDVVLFGIFIFFLGMLCGYVVQIAFGNGNDEGLESEENPPKSADILAGAFYARVKQRDDVESVNIYFAQVKVWPSRFAWPGVAVTGKNQTQEGSIHSLIQVRGLSVPRCLVDWSRPHVQNERERARFAEAIEYVWALLSKSETLVLRNIAASEGGVICDVYLHIGGKYLNLAEMLIADGHARPAGNYDWGARIVKEIKEKP